MALLDNGTQIRAVTSEFIETHAVDMEPPSDLIGRWVICAGLGNTLTWPIGYVIIQVQVDGAQGYDEDQVTLIVPDLSNFAAWIPLILVIPMIGHIMNVIKESLIDMLAMPWVNTHVACLLAVWWATTMLEGNKVTTRVLDPTKYNEVVTTKGCEMINTFSSKIIHAWMKSAFTGVRLNVVTHTLHAGEGPLPPGLMIQIAYTEMHNGSRNVAIVVRSSTA